jgi:hypothetical protein
MSTATTPSPVSGSPISLGADMSVLDAPSYRHLAYRPGVPLVRALPVAPTELPTAPLRGR